MACASRTSSSVTTANAYSRLGFVTPKTTVETVLMNRTVVAKRTANVRQSNTPASRRTNVSRGASIVMDRQIVWMALMKLDAVSSPIL